MSTPALRDREHHNYGEYLRWPDDASYELIDGVAYLMAPAPTLDHQEVAGEVYYQLTPMRLAPPLIMKDPRGVLLLKG